ncbi:hypothetical protein I3843_04G078500 [Carya illinoinensis]|nr:hypothetical protein I3843_04G078500 [Carya illinoinensis]
MENEQFCFPVSPRYYDGLHGGSLETSYSLQTGDPFSQNTMQGGIFAFSDMERLLGCELNQGEEEQVGVLINGNTPLKVIQEELMEDSSLTDLLLMGAEARLWVDGWVAASSNEISHLGGFQQSPLQPKCAILECYKRLHLSNDCTPSLEYLLAMRDFYYQIHLQVYNSFHKLAMFFTQGLHYRTTNTTEMHHKLLSRQTNTTAAFQMLQELSPCVKFAHFISNQAILEASQGEEEVHVIEFDIMEGIKDASFKVTAIVVDQENAAIVHQTGRRLKVGSDANCMMHRLQMQTRSLSTVNNFLAGVSRLLPKTIVLVEEELYNFARISSMSFAEFFNEALHYYDAFSNSLASSSGVSKFETKKEACPV